MIVLITGASHVGKTCLAQRILEKYHFPYLSIDHLKMGLIRSKNTHLTPMDDAELTEYLWPIVREMVKTAVENGQNLVVEGCYIPADWKKDFDETYLSEIRYLCLAFSENYVRKHFDAVKGYASIIEKRLDDSCCTLESVLADNKEVIRLARLHQNPLCVIDENYEIDLSFLNGEEV